MIFCNVTYNLPYMLLQIIKRKILKLIASYGYELVNVNPNSTKFLYRENQIKKYYI